MGKRGSGKGRDDRAEGSAKARTRAPRQAVRAPVAPYLAVGLSTVVHGVGERKHIRRNLQTIEEIFHAAVSVAGINMPVKVVALPEGALTGFTDEVFDT